MSDLTVTVPLDTVADMITRARAALLVRLDQEAATWVTAIAVMVGRTPATRTDICGYLSWAIQTEQPVSTDLIAAEHVIRIGASS